MGTNFFKSIIAITAQTLNLVLQLLIYFTSLPLTLLPYEVLDFLNFDTFLLVLFDLLKLLPNYSLSFSTPPSLSHLSFILFLDLEKFYIHYVPQYSFNLLLKKATYLLNYTNQPTQIDTYTTTSQNLLTESTLNMRYQRNLNPIFRYDYKLGNYFTKEDSIVTPYLFTTINELTGGIRKSS